MEKNNELTTTRFRISNFKFSLLLFRLLAGWWLLPPVIIFITAIILSVAVDLAYAIVALMVLFILIPSMMAFLYIYYGLAPNCWMNIIEKELSLSSSGIEIKMYIKQKLESREESFGKPFDEEIPTENDNPISEENDVENVEYEIEERTKIIEWHEIENMNVSTDNIILSIKGKPKGFLYIPISAIVNLSKFLNELRSKINGSKCSK